MGVKPKTLATKSRTIKENVVDFSKVSDAAKQVKYVSDADGDNVDTTAFEQASLHLKNVSPDGQEEHVGAAPVGRFNENTNVDDADAIGSLADINAASLQELDEAS